VVTDKSGCWKILWDLPWFLLFKKFCFQQTARGFQNVAKNNFFHLGLKGLAGFQMFHTSRFSKVVLI